jgi:hypothetical protein
MVILFLAASNLIIIKKILFSFWEPFSLKHTHTPMCIVLMTSMIMMLLLDYDEEEDDDGGSNQVTK